MYSHADRIPRWPVFAGLLVFVLALNGCGGDTTYPAEGKVRFKDDGKPVVGVMVIFEPKPTGTEPPRYSSRATTDENGHFRLETFKNGDGALEGVNRIRISQPRSDKGDIEKPGSIPEVIHPKYLSFETSGLERTVTRDRTKNVFEIEVERAPRQ
jgi:hypothetical protein